MLDKNKLTTERARGWIMNFLYDYRPAPMEITLLQQCLDTVDFPMTFLHILREIDFLRSENLVRVFSIGEERELSEVEQAKLIQRCAKMDDEVRKISVRIRTDGINFQEGNRQCVGVARVI